MSMRRSSIPVSIALAMLVWAAPVAAGNWATAEMDQSAPTPVAGAETEFGFEILRHGVTPASWVTATFVATNLTTKAQIQAPMQAQGPDGRFVARITFPDAGEWTWYVLLAELGTDQDGAGGTLTVVTPAHAATLVAGALEPRFGPALDRLAEAAARWLASASGAAAG